MDGLDVVRAGIPKVDDCPVLGRLNAFLVDQGVSATLEHAFRDRAGRVVDLSPVLSPSGAPAGSVTLRAKEWLGVGANPATDPRWEVAGTASDPSAGLVRAVLPDELAARAGIYELSWGISDATGRLLAVNQAMLSVERTQFADPASRLGDLGPLTVGEIRLALVDSGAADNTLLDAVEFSDAQVLAAIVEPVRRWNEAPPPILRYTTRDFPFRGAWLSGVCAHLHIMAANHYRRNRLPGSAGGVQVDDKGKEREYMAEGMRLMQEYDAWVATKKVTLNMRRFVGGISSAYSGSAAGW